MLELLPSRLDPLLKLLSTLHTSRARAIVVADREWSPLEGLLREAGALQVVFSTRRFDLPARMVRRHMADGANVEPTLRQFIWAKLPWQQHDITQRNAAQNWKQEKNHAEGSD